MRASTEARPGRDFGATDTWIFDLDNTLYPSECNLFAQVDRRMGEFIVGLLGVTLPEAKRLQKSYYYEHGTTLAGLMKLHGIEPGRFLDYVHDIDYSPVAEAPELAAAIASLPGRKLIFTNGSRRHAEAVARRLGVLAEFEDIFDIADAAYVPKPRAEAYGRLLEAHGIDAARSAMFEDLPHNLEVPHALGMTTVLVHSTYDDHPIYAEIRNWRSPPDHVHHMTADLAGFLGGIAKS
jgi:putative hydrolase of the HAD superfamily